MGVFHAGAAETDITPLLGAFLTGSFKPRPAEDIDDPLYAKAVVLDDGETRLAMVVLDLIAVPREVVTKIRSLIAEHTEIPPSHVMIGCTHTHTGPQTRESSLVPRDDSYVEWLIHRVSDTVRLAANRLEPARIAWGQGEQHDISFCRRFLMTDGTVRTNPGRPGLAGDDKPQIVKPVSPIDPAVGVLVVESIDGRPLAVVAQFSLHYVGTDNSLHISADYYGHFATVMRQHLGEECIPLLFNGTSGQINNIDPLGPPRETRGHAQARKVASALAGEVLKVMARIPFHEECTLSALSVTVPLPCKRVTEEDRAIAREILAGNDPNPENGPFSFVVGQPIPTALRGHYAGLVANMKAHVEGEVQALRVGESAWVALPGEIFVEIGLAIKASAPASDTFVVGLANDSLGYIPTDHALTQEGGYETWATAGPGAEGLLVNTSERLLSQLFADGSGSGSQAVSEVDSKGDSEGLTA